MNMKQKMIEAIQSSVDDEFMVEAILAMPEMKKTIKFITEDAFHRTDCDYHYNKAKECKCGLLELRNTWR